MCKPLRVLIVEDSEDDALMVMRELRKSGYAPTFERVETAEAMSSALGAQPWDLVICDYALPQFSGPAALALFRERGPDVPFVVVSGGIGEDAAVEMMRAGAHDYIMKENLGRLGPAVERELREADARAKRREAEKMLRETHRQIVTWNEVSNVLLTVPREQMYAKVLQVVLTAMQSKQGAFGYIREDGGLVCASFVGGDWEEYRTSGEDIVVPRDAWAGIWGRALSEEKPLCSNDPLPMPGGHTSAHRAIAVPIIHQGRVIGLLMVANRPTDYTENDERLVKAIADQLAPVLDARLQSDRDDAQRKQVEEALRESEARYRHLFEHLNDAAFLADIETGLILETNLAGEALLGRPRAEIVGMHQTDLHPPDQAEAYREKFARHVAQGVLADYDGEVVRADGTIVPVSVSASTISVRGERLILGLFHDISARKEAEDERRILERQLYEAQKLESLGMLAGGVAHDFNNQLTAIVGLAELAMRQVEPGSEAYQRIAAIPKQVERGADLVRQLLAFGRRSVSEFKPLDLHSLVKGTAKLLERTLPENIEIRLALEDGVATVLADATQVQQVIMNLATNARDAMPEGGQLTIGLHNASLDAEYCQQHADLTPGEYVCLSVEDTGTGMTPEVRQRVFEPFFTTKPVGEGTGLGLAAVFGIAKSHGGHVHVYSEVGEGSVLRVYLPTTDAAASLEEAPPELPSGGTETLLLIEDDLAVLEVGTAVLESLGYTVLTAMNGEEGLDVYRSRREQIALVITDMMMPRMGAEELYEALRSADPEVKVLLTSGYGLQDKLHALREMGIRGFVQKPFDLVKLGRAVRRALDG